jgi:hypothetical protein
MIAFSIGEAYENASRLRLSCQAFLLMRLRQINIKDAVLTTRWAGTLAALDARIETGTHLPPGTVDSP